MRLSSSRKWLVYWMYLMSAGHFAVSVLISWFLKIDLLDGYHNEIVRRFGETSPQLHNLHVWWLNLFGASLQNIAIFMLVLIYVGNKFRSEAIWLWMTIGLVLWFPQDIIISLRINLWTHVWIDVIALSILLPPLVALWLIDKNNTRNNGRF